MNTLNVSNQDLTKAVVGAAAAAVLILGLFVLPAERGIDVTGIGRALGLTGMSAKKVETAASTPALGNVDFPVPNRASIEKLGALRSDEMQITLPPNAGAEIKAQMKKGDHLIFQWQATGGAVNVDMHGERPNAGKAFTSYWKAVEQTSAQGAFTAPFDGTHGWYWRNRGDETVVIKVRTSGFYQRLFQPHGA